MKALRRSWKRLAGVLTGSRREAEMADELEAHLGLLIDDNLRRGLPPEEARRAALVTFGGVEWTKERVREQRGLPFADTLRQDLRYALRGMRRSPGFTAVAVVCLALGIGANTAILSILDAVMIRTLPVDHPEQLVMLAYESKSYPRSLRATGSGYGSTSLPHPAFEEMRRGARTLSALAAFVPLGFNNRSLTVNTGGQPAVAGGQMVSGNYFQALGVAPWGRAITPDDLQPGAPNVAVVSHAYAERVLGGARTALGRAIGLNGAPFTIVGVAPPGFFGVDPQLAPDFWLPLHDMPSIKPWGIQPDAGEELFENRRWWWCMMIGRLKSGVTRQQARSELDVLFGQSVMAGLSHPPPPAEMAHIVLSPASRGLEDLQRQFSQPLKILMIAVGVVLLIACANLAALLLARAKARQKEIGVRLALGASRGRLVRQFLTESVLLSLAGGAAGLLLAQWGSRALLLMMAGQDRALGLDIRTDATVLALTAGISLLTGMLFGLAPALRSSRLEVASELKKNAASVSPRAGLGRVLVAVQVALSVCLLFGASLFIRTLGKLQSQDFGFHREHVALFDLDPRGAGYHDDQVTQIYDRVLHGIQALPGVRDASASAMALLSGMVNNSSASTDGSPLPAGADNAVFWNRVGPSFFHTMSIPVQLGRDLEWRDMNGRRVAVVNEAMARRFFPGENPLGHRFSFGEPYQPERSYEIIGVVQNAKYDSVRNQPPLTAYVPYSGEDGGNGRMSFEVRTAGDPLAIVAALRAAVRAVDPNLPLIGIRTQEQQMNEALRAERMFARITAFFGLLALLPVAVGLYGTLAYGVARRTGEIGIRMALGAGRAGVLWMVLRESLVVVACGIAAGLPAAFALTRLAASQFFGVQRFDAPAIAATVLILSAAALAAGLLPATRAAHIDPLRALRYE